MTLHRVADITFVVVCAVLLAVVGIEMNGYWRHQEIQSATEAIVAPGTVLAGESDPGPNRTLVIYVSPSCHYCEESLPLYKRLYAESLTPTSHFSVTFESVVAQTALVDYLVAKGLGGAPARSTPPPAGVFGTPTLIVIGPGRTVLGSWAGVLGPAQEAALHRLLVG